MKNYLAFYGSTFYPMGGMHDLIGDFDNVEDAIIAIIIKNNQARNGDWSTSWGHVYSLKDKTIVTKREFIL
jgi:hypothetical protein